jgi:CheY-like chemotaxis protein
MSARPRVLCIEDDPATVELLVEVLEDEGFQTIVAADGIEGVRKFAERPDLILCDVDMPHMSGFGVLSELRKAQVGKEAAHCPVPLHHRVRQPRESSPSATTRVRRFHHQASGF